MIKYLFLFISIIFFYSCGSSNGDNCFIPDFSDGIVAIPNSVFFTPIRFDSPTDNSFIQLVVEFDECFMQYFPDLTTSNTPYSVSGFVNEDNICEFQSGTVSWSGTEFVDPRLESSGNISLSNNELLTVENVVIGGNQVPGITASCADDNFIPPSDFPATVECTNDEEYLVNFENFSECPTDATASICQTYSCTLQDQEDPFSNIVITHGSCEVIDCFTMRCDITGNNSFEVIGEGVFTIDELVNTESDPEKLFNGEVLIDDSEVPTNFECNIRRLVI